MKRILHIMAPVLVAILVLVGFLSFQFWSTYTPIDQQLLKNPLYSAVMKKYHMNDSAFVQYIKYLGAALTLNFGPSFYSKASTALEVNLAGMKSTIIINIFMMMTVIGMQYMPKNKKKKGIEKILFIVICSIGVLNIFSGDGFINVVGMIAVIVMYLYLVFIDGVSPIIEAVGLMILLMSIGVLLSKIGMKNLDHLIISHANNRDYPAIACAKYLKVFIPLTCSLVLFYVVNARSKLKA